MSGTLHRLRARSFTLHSVSALIAIGAVFFCTPAHAQHVKSYRAGTLVIEAPWSRATPGGAKVAGGYFKITNTGSSADRLVGGSSAAAGRIEVHEMALTDGVMRMRPLKDGLEIPAGGTVEFKPGGHHVMMLDLKHGLSEGDIVRGTLVFENAGTVEIQYRVGPIGAASHGPRSGSNMNGHAPKGGH